MDEPESPEDMLAGLPVPSEDAQVVPIRHFDEGGIVDLLNHHGIETPHGVDIYDNPEAMPVEPQVSRVDIDADPEFWYGLTMWGGGYHVSKKTEVGTAFQVRAGGSLSISIDGEEVELARDQVIHLRDLLNVATVRGALA